MKNKLSIKIYYEGIKYPFILRNEFEIDPIYDPIRDCITGILQDLLPEDFEKFQSGQNISLSPEKNKSLKEKIRTVLEEKLNVRDKSYIKNTYPASEFMIFGKKVKLYIKTFHEQRKAQDNFILALFTLYKLFDEADVKNLPVHIHHWTRSEISS